MSYGYCLHGGWRAPYRETSGSISTTFFDLTTSRGCGLSGRAIDICRWLCRVQNADGSIANPEYGENGIVFDTGQVLEGYLRHLVRRMMRGSSRRESGSDLAGHRGRSGREMDPEHFLGVPHAYNTRTAWPLLRLGAISPHPEYTRVARANLDWALEQQGPRGFSRCAFNDGWRTSHIRSPIRSRDCWGPASSSMRARYVDAARRGAEVALPQSDPTGRPGPNRQRRPFGCLLFLPHSNCQLAAVWARLYGGTGMNASSCCRTGAPLCDDLP